MKPDMRFKRCRHICQTVKPAIAEIYANAARIGEAEHIAGLTEPFR